MDQDWQERLMAQLDEDRPDWAFAWAEQADLRDLRGMRQERFEELLRQRVAARMFHPIIHAALGAGIVREVE